MLERQQLQHEQQQAEETLEMINSIIYLMAQTGSPPRLNVAHAVFDEGAREEVARQGKHGEEEEGKIELRDC